MIRKSPKSADIIHPILRGRDIDAYDIKFADLWIIFIPWHFPLHKDSSVNGSSLKAENAFKEEYPEIFEHLLQFKFQLSERNKAETGIRYEWYALQRCANTYFDEFKKEKIVYPNMTKFLPFVYDTSGFYINQKCFIITGKYLGYLTAFLNSSLFKFCFRENFPELLGGTRELSKVFFEKIPVKPVSNELEQIFLQKINVIQELKKQNKETIEHEQEIEKILHSIYELDEMESLIINNVKL